MAGMNFGLVSFCNQILELENDDVLMLFTGFANSLIIDLQAVQCSSKFNIRSR